MGVNSLSTALRLRFEPGPYCAWVLHANHSATEPPMPGDGVMTKHTHSRSMASWRSVNWIFWLSAWFWLLSSTSSFRRSRISDSRNMVLYSSSCFWDAANTTAAPSRPAAWPAAVSFFIFADICQNNYLKNYQTDLRQIFGIGRSVTVDDLKLVFRSLVGRCHSNQCLLVISTQMSSSDIR